MGGCIVVAQDIVKMWLVSSLYGRVYRGNCESDGLCRGFLPIWEGVSWRAYKGKLRSWFPPYMGGCIVDILPVVSFSNVSSLYGRVYRKMVQRAVDGERFLPVWEGVSNCTISSRKKCKFPPYTGGYRRNIMYNSNSKSIGSRITNDMLPRVEDKFSFLSGLRRIPPPLSASVGGRMNPLQYDLFL